MSMVGPTYEDNEKSEEEKNAKNSIDEINQKVSGCIVSIGFSCR